MARFIETSDGWIFNTANVVKIGPERPDPRGFRSRKVFLADGSTYEVSAGLVGEQIADPIIAAHPGWALVYRDETWLLPPDPILAWRIAHIGEPWPITVKGPASFHQEWAVVAPDGRVYVLGDASWDSLEEADAALRKRDEQRRPKVAEGKGRPT
ncbi:MAG: hypothetical protein ABW003_25075 [Microvirga sp.]